MRIRRKKNQIKLNQTPLNIKHIMRGEWFNEVTF